MTSFSRGHEYEISQVHKISNEAKTYLVGTSAEKYKKLVMHQVTMNREILQPKIASEDSFTKKEIQKKNCLTLIVKNCNIAYPKSIVIEGLRQIMGARNIVQAYYSRGDST